MYHYVEHILALAENSEGFYNGALEEFLPWTFWVQDLPDPHADVMRLLRIWQGDYIECYHFDKGVTERYGYLFRDGLGFGYLSISENMGFQYFRYFFDRGHARREISRPPSPSKVTTGLPSEDAITNVDISDDDLPAFLSFARAVAIGYVTGNDYSEQVRDLVLHFRDLVAKDPARGS